MSRKVHLPGGSEGTEGAEERNTEERRNGEKNEEDHLGTQEFKRPVLETVAVIETAGEATPKKPRNSTWRRGCYDSGMLLDPAGVNP